MNLYGQVKAAELALEAAASGIPERFTRARNTSELDDYSSRRQDAVLGLSGAVDRRSFGFLASFAGKWAWSGLPIDNFLCTCASRFKGVIRVSIDHAVLRLFAARCIGRRDSYALQQADGRYLRERQPVTGELLRLHLAGALTLGTYLIDEQGLCRFAVIDADARCEQDDLVALVGVQERLAAAGMASALECSRRGGHVWVFLAQRAEPAVLRRWLLPFCPAGMEFYPKQERASWAEPGSLMRVPLGVHRRSGRRYPFLRQVGGLLVPVARTVAETVAWLGSVERVTLPKQLAESAAAPAPARLSLDQAAAHETHTYVATTGAAALPSPLTSIHAWCASQDSVAVIGRYVELDQRGMGCCPFGDHHTHGRDVHPSLWVHEPRGPGAPCWYCHTWGRGGNLFDFLCLYTGLDARSLWARIRAGEVF